MYPPVFEVCAASPDVQTNFGLTPCKIYPYGEAPKNLSLPYAVWQVVNGSPENCISNVPDIDSYTLQINVYAETVSAVRDAAKAIRDAIEPHAYVTGWGGEGRENDTDYYRYVFLVDWFVERETVS